MCARGELGIGREDRQRIVARLLEQVELGGDVGELQLRQAVLARAKEFAGTAKPQIHLSDVESVTRVGHGTQSLLCIFCRARGDENAIRRFASAPNATSQLMKLA